MGFSLVDAPPENFPVEADDEDVDIPHVEPEVEGAKIPEGQIAIELSPEDEINVNGTMLREDSGLAALRAGCSFYGLFTSGSKSKCFKRLLEHSKNLELDMVMAAARESQRSQERHPLAPVSAEVRSEWEQSQHRLTHTPFRTWCSSCLAHRARADKHERTGKSHAGPVPTICFDYFFPKADGQAGKESEADSTTSPVVVDSHTMFVTAITMEGKTQLDHAGRELIKFMQMPGYGEVILHCDNEPIILQLKRLVMRTRQAMGLKRRETSIVAYDKSLAENSIGRIRPLAH